MQWDVSVRRWLYSTWSLREPRLLLPCGSCFSSGLKALSSSWWVGGKKGGKHIYFLSTQTTKGHTSFLTAFFSWKLVAQPHLDVRKLYTQSLAGSHCPATSWHYASGMVSWLSVHSQPCSPSQTACRCCHSHPGWLDVLRYDFILTSTIPLLLKVPQVGFLQILQSKLQEDMELGVRVGILSRKANVSVWWEGRINGHLCERCSLTPEGYDCI